MKPWPFILGILFITLAIVVGLRLDKAGLAVAVGVVCGILAGLPVSGVLFLMLQRERQDRQRLEEQQRWRQERQPMTPPVIVLNAGRAEEMLPGGMALPMGRPMRDPERQFVIVGEEEGQRNG